MSTLSPSKISYSLKEASEATGVAESTLRKLIAAGHIATTTPRGTTKRVILREELEDWLNG